MFIFYRNKVFALTICGFTAFATISLDFCVSLSLMQWKTITASLSLDQNSNTLHLKEKGLSYSYHVMAAMAES